MSNYFICKIQVDPKKSLVPESLFLQKDETWGQLTQDPHKFTSIDEAVKHLPVAPPNGYICGKNSVPQRYNLKGVWVTRDVYRAALRR